MLRDLAACPRCRGELEWSGPEARCAACGAAYGASGGVPVLLPPDTAAPGLDPRWDAGARALVPPRVLRYRRFLRPVLTYKTRHSRALVEGFVASYPAGAIVLNVGAGETRYGPNVLNLEIRPGPEADVVGVAERLPIRDASCDGVILMAVLEHVADEQETLAEAARVLKPGGRLLVDVPFLQGYHASPADYRRYTEQGLRAELERHGFELEGSGVAVGPGSAAAWVVSEFLALLVSGRSARVYRFARLATAWLALPLKYADAWLERHPMAYVIPSAVWAIGRRQSSS
jgi:SAM-dependent methyltransferase/uncharacterized protein YbaR (Trm112 family)